ncbi:hypothetical protein KSP39_PZI006892 [Platanthera zijinensis]|uniref:DIS3-like exonuclease 2 n=1 Tax=Platanthera zijinensis TaxID=2320716 RepID=A0AAP0BQH2_9ASPA
MRFGDKAVAFMAEDGDKNKGRRRQNRRLKQSSLQNNPAKAPAEVTGGATSNFFPLPLSPPSSPSYSEPPSPNISCRGYFAPHLSEKSVKAAVEKGNAFKATFRVNAYNPQEAYCTINGVPVDVLIDGKREQNRAVEGDLVAIALDPVSDWANLRGANPNLSLQTTPAIDSCSAGGGSNFSLRESFDAVFEHGDADRALCWISAMKTHPLKRPTGRVLAILKRSPKRQAVTGYLSMEPSPLDGELLAMKWIQLIPRDARFPQMSVSVRNLPDSVRERVKSGDLAVKRELVGAEMFEWRKKTIYPQARITDVFGRGGEIEPQIAAILFENLISTAEFSQKSLSCLPPKPWKMAEDELKRRRDLRKVCSFTIDPPRAFDLDDALSVEIVSDEILRIGVHIADVSYFVLPDTDLDREAQCRSTSVYILQRRSPLLPPELSEELCSLLPGEDRLTFSIIWDMSSSGEIIRRWIGRSIINSCCKLSYDLVQDVIDKSFNVDELGLSTGIETCGGFSLKDVAECLRNLYEISKQLREIRFNDGALQLRDIKPTILFDESGAPVDCMVKERMESSCLVEEFMLLANRSVAEVIFRAFPDCAVLIRHPGPLARKLRDFGTFWNKRGFKLDTSSSGQFRISLSKIMEEIKDDPVLCEILTFFAIKTMQSAAYFCTGDLVGGEDECSHYALSVPYYTHFTSPIRRYPDIIVHRILRAALHAEMLYLKQSEGGLETPEAGFENTCFTGLHFDKQAAESKFGRETLSVSASKFKLLQGDTLREVVAHCNERKLAGRHAGEAGAKLCIWALLKEKEILVTEARVLSLGPRFMSVYINKFAVERRINYSDAECLSIEWLEVTGKLVIDLNRSEFLWRRVENFCPLKDVVLLTEPTASDLDEEDGETVTFGALCANSGLSEKSKLETVVFPLVLESFSSIPVALHAIGGDDGPLDIGVRLYVSSYFT